MSTNNFNVLQRHHFELFISSDLTIATFNRNDEYLNQLKCSVTSVSYNMKSKVLEFNLLATDQTIHFVDNITDKVRLKYILHSVDGSHKYVLFDGVVRVKDINFKSDLNLSENGMFNPLTIKVVTSTDINRIIFD